MSLLDRAKHALLWNAAFNIFRDFLGLIVMLVLVRLLEPEQYGKFALVTAIIGFISVFAHQNFVAHTIQVRADEDVNYQDHFTAGGLIQCAMFAVTNIVAFGLTYFESYVEIAPLVHMMSIGFLLEWPCELRLKMLERSLDWGRLRLLHAVGLVISSAVAIAMGFMGAGVYALLVPGLLVTLPFIVDLFFYQNWRPTWSWNRERYIPAFRFGVTRMTSGLASRARRLIESGAVVYVLGFSSAGLFERAVSLGLMFCQRAATQLMYTLYPVMTKLEPGTDQYRRASAIVLRGVAWFTIPIAVVLVVLAAPFVRLVYGDYWVDVIPLVPAAVTLGAIAAVSYVIYMLILAHDEERRCAYSDLLELFGTLVALALLLEKGLLSYLLGLIVVRLAVLAYGIYVILAGGAMRRRELSNALFPPIAASGIAYVVCEGVLSMTAGLVDTAPVVMLYPIAYLIVYAAFLRVIFGDVLVELVRYLPGNRMLSRVLMFGQYST